jgi:transposase-like protein
VKYTPNPKPWAYPEEVRRKALQMYVDGMNLRRIARHLGVHHRTVSLWVKAQAAQLPDPPTPEQVKEAEMDELFTFIGEKKIQSTKGGAKPPRPGCGAKRSVCERVAERSGASNE